MDGNLKIGLVDLDTSHPESWIPILRKMGHSIAGVWDGGSVHPRGYSESFIIKHKIPRVYDSLVQMAADVDCAIIHSCNWDLHIQRSQPFVHLGKSVLIDKPIAGSEADIRQFLGWVGKGARITGGSSLRYCDEVTAWLAQAVAVRGTPETVFCGCGVDEFNYGIHAWSLLGGLMGPGAISVQSLKDGIQQRFIVRWPGGHSGIIQVGEARAYLPFYATVVTERGVSHLKAENNRLYDALLSHVVPYLSGQMSNPPVPFDILIESERCALAGLRSRNEGNREVRLTELYETDRGFDGRLFTESYRRAKYPDPK